MIRLIKPYIEYKHVEKEYKEMFESGFLTKGQYSKQLPKNLCEYTGANFAFNTTSATTALSACLDVLGIKPGDEVIVSDFSFPATANVVEAIGAVPIFADVDLDTFNMSVDELKNKISEKTRCVIFVSALGNPSGLQDIKDVCELNNIPLIHDAACAIGSSINKAKVGSIADFECFSFHPRKLITAGEGGAITTNNNKYAEQLAIKLAHGAETVDGKMEFVSYGFNYRLTEMQCIMIIKQLELIDEIISSRNVSAEEYKKGLSGMDFCPQKVTSDVVHNKQSVVFKLPECVDQKKLISHLHENGIESTIGTYSLSNTKYYKNKYGTPQQNSLELENNTITLPSYKDIDTAIVINQIAEYFKSI